MMTLSNNSGQMEKGQQSTRKRILPRLLILVGFGAMVLTICSLLLGCGSDGKSKSAVNGKSDKADVSKKKGTEPMLPLVTEKGSTPKGPSSGGIVNKFDQYLSGVPNPKAKMDELNAAAVKSAESLNPEILPGVTRREMESKMEKAREMAQSLNVEILPGITKEEIDRKMQKP